MFRNWNGSVPLATQYGAFLSILLAYRAIKRAFRLIVIPLANVAKRFALCRCDGKSSGFCIGVMTTDGAFLQASESEAWWLGAVTAVVVAVVYFAQGILITIVRSPREPTVSSLWNMVRHGSLSFRD